MRNPSAGSNRGYGANPNPIEDPLATRVAALGDAVAKVYPNQRIIGYEMGEAPMNIVFEPPSEPKTVREGPLAGVRVCVTGTLSKSRSDIQAAIEAAGGIFDKSVKKGVVFVFAKSAKAAKPGAKRTKKGAKKTARKASVGSRARTAAKVRKAAKKVTKKRAKA